MGWENRHMNSLLHHSVVSAALETHTKAKGVVVVVVSDFYPGGEGARKALEKETIFELNHGEGFSQAEK